MPISNCILVVEDNQDIAQLLKVALSRKGYQVVLAGDGVRGLELSQQCQPGLILLDKHLPQMDGPEFARAYQQTTNHPAPLVAMTASGEAEEFARQIKAVAILTKPFALTHLFELLAQLESKETLPVSA
jgi:two-component system response regulator VicR